MTQTFKHSLHKAPAAGGLRKSIFAGAALLALTALGAGTALAAGTLRIGMTASDIPLTTGQTDQGGEGQRFMGYTIYNALIEWDLSSADKPSVLTPGLAETWAIDETDKLKWTFKLRDGVKFLVPSGLLEFPATSAKWMHCHISEPPITEVYLEYHREGDPLLSKWCRTKKFYRIIKEQDGITIGHLIAAEKELAELFEKKASRCAKSKAQQHPFMAIGWITFRLKQNTDAWKMGNVMVEGRNFESD